MPYHLITLSARASTLGGMAKPIFFAVFRLISNSNLVGCSTGRSAGLAPLRILSMARNRAGAVIIQPLFAGGLGLAGPIAELATKNRLPTISDGLRFAEVPRHDHVDLHAHQLRGNVGKALDLPVLHSDARRRCSVPRHSRGPAALREAP
jgi:hypothetical protein